MIHSRFISCFSDSHVADSCFMKCRSNAHFVLLTCSIAHELKKEANMSMLHHINIVALLAIIFELGHYGIVMEYVLHGSLNDFILTYYV